MERKNGVCKHHGSPIIASRLEIEEACAISSIPQGHMQPTFGNATVIAWEGNYHKKASTY